MLDQLPDWKELSRDQKIEMVRPLVDQGRSSSQIAAHFRHTTRNTIIGLCSRHGMKLQGNTGAIDKKQNPAKAKGTHGNKGQPKANAIVARASAKAAQPPQNLDRMFDMEDGEGVDVSSLVGTLQNKGCKFILGDPLAQHGYCGKPFKAGSKSWCSAHHARVYLRSTR